MPSHLPETSVLNHLKHIYTHYKQKDVSSNVGVIKEFASTTFFGFFTSKINKGLVSSLDQPFEDSAFDVADPEEMVDLCINLGREAHKVQLESINISRRTETMHACRWYVLSCVADLQFEYGKLGRRGDISKLKVKDMQHEDVFLLAYLKRVGEIVQYIKELESCLVICMRHRLEPSTYNDIRESIFAYKRDLGYLGFPLDEDFKNIFPEKKYEFERDMPMVLQPMYLQYYLIKYNCHNFEHKDIVNKFLAFVQSKRPDAATPSSTRPDEAVPHLDLDDEQKEAVQPSASP